MSAQYSRYIQYLGRCLNHSTRYVYLYNIVQVPAVYNIILCFINFSAALHILIYHFNRGEWVVVHVYRICTRIYYNGSKPIHVRCNNIIILIHELRPLPFTSADIVYHLNTITAPNVDVSTYLYNTQARWSTRNTWSIARALVSYYIIMFDDDNNIL